MKGSTLLAACAVLACCLAWGALCPAEDAGPPDLAGLRENFSSVRSLRTDFVQEKRMRILSRPLVSEGHFCYRAPADIRWEYTSPIRSVLLLEGADAKRYTWRNSAWEEERGTGLEAMRLVLRDISGWVSGDFESSRHFTAQGQSGPPVRVTLTPRDPSMENVIQRVVLTLSSRPGVLESVEIVEGPENTTRIEFRNTEINVSFPPGLFREVVPGLGNRGGAE